MNSPEYREAEIIDLFAKQKKHRSNGNLAESYNMLEQIEQRLTVFDQVDFYKLWSRFFFEKASLLRNDGRYEEAAVAFDESSKAAGLGSDALREWIGKFECEKIKYLANYVSAREFYNALTALYKVFQASCCGSHELADLRDNYECYLYIRLLEAAFESDQNAEFSYWSEKLLSNEFFMSMATVDTLNGDVGNAAFTLIQKQVTSRIFMRDGDYSAAISGFMSYMPCEDLLSDLDRYFIGFEQVAKTYMEGWREELARDYRDLGRSVLQAEGKKGAELCKKILLKGLECDENMGNTRYLVDIHAEMKALKLAAA